MVGGGWLQGPECPKSRLHEEEKTLNSEYGELCNVYMKDLTVKLRIYQKFAAFFNVSANQIKLSSPHRPV